ncbi:MAG: aerobic carbon-monoxide dehydrogenase medium subunit [Methylobacteriaceae bacterium]|jgi:carbon-monoxide dehydrogenase medium subunit|nr:aerobic carbon-monoxide dehydrogenase medium subunit [Methylobacteriaceae bacterium]
MYAFTHHSASSVSDAVSTLGANEDAKFLAGGQTLLPTMKQRLAAPPHLIDLGKVKELRGIEVQGDKLVIKAMSRHYDVATSDAVKNFQPGLAELAGLIGDPAVRHRGTIGGSIANNDPAADYPAACLALGATIVTNKRRLEAEKFFTGLFSTALDDNEIVTAVEFPKADKFKYMKFRNPASRYAMVGVAVAKTGGTVRVAVTGAGSDGVFRWKAAEEKLAQNFEKGALEGLSIDPSTLNGDIHGSREYRAHLIAVMAKRAVAGA